MIAQQSHRVSYRDGGNIFSEGLESKKREFRGVSG